ncbi:hypothetical protein GS504_01325 [Rhodococcus hoagii]|nr:hypothetical protein [Prescottella equi]NKS71686.1 hypothetical protein [Prescottella equi]
MSTTAEFPAAFLPEAKAAIDAANKKLARAGITERFSYDVAIEYRQTGDQDGARDGISYSEWVVMTLSHPEIAFGGWMFVGTLAFEEGGTVVRSPHGVDLSGWKRPGAQHCDHCHSNRRRTTTYVVRHLETGEVRQIGSNCITLFLGVKPSGLWALGWSLPEPSLGGDDDGEPAQGGSHVPVRYALATAAVVTDEGRRYVSRARAAESDSHPPTVEVVLDALIGQSTASEFVDWQRSIRAQADAYERDHGSTLDAVVAAAMTVDADSDYGANLRAVLGSEYIGIRNVGIAISALAVYRRALADEELRAATASGYLAEVGEKIGDLDAVVTVANEQVDYYGRAMKVSTLLVMRTDDGHVVKWRASKTLPFGRGDKVRILRATVKAHGEYQGVDQTVVVRAQLAAA